MVRTLHLSVFLLSATVANAAGLTYFNQVIAPDDKTKEDKEAKEAKMAAVNKVVKLLEDLQKDVLAEGEKEAATYNKFACFCKDTSKDKADAITEGGDAKEALTADITKLDQERSELDTTIGDLEDKIAETEKEIKDAEEKRAKELKDYQAVEADLSSAIHALEMAIQSLKASKSPSLLEYQEVAKTVSKAALMADALGIECSKAQRVTAFFLQGGKDVPTEDYKFHSDDIIETLEKLLKDFTKEKTTADEEEAKAAHEHEMLIQEKTDLVKRKTTDLEEAKKKQSEKQEKIATKSEDLTTVAADLIDDQEYLMELNSMCADQAKTWDQRSKVRSNELAALTAAMDIIKSKVSEKTSSKTVRFAQEGFTVSLAAATAKDEEAMEAVEADTEEKEAAPGQAVPGFLQRHSKRRHVGSDIDVGREEVIALLRRRGQMIKSTLLTSLAGQLAADKKDKFAKIKKLIEELIERLLQESTNEANQKGWCDKSIADAEQKRDHAAEDIEELNNNMAELAALKDKLAEELAILGNETETLTAKKKEAEKMRKEEKAENEATVKEAEEGLSAVEEAIKVLKDFYDEHKKAKVDLSFAQQGPKADAPDAGFKSGEAYKGSQGQAGGVLGMLDVIKSDFKRTIKETEKAEAKAEDDHLAFMTETEKSLAEKDVAIKEKTKQKDSAKEKYTADEDEMKSKSDILKTSIEELLELKPACIDTGMSYADRVAKREEEIAALNKALCILTNYAKYGADGSGSSC